ncbi:MAG: hypothetical protein ACI31S_03410 [Bacilli bacterium]
MAIMISEEVKNGFAYEAAKIAVTTGRDVKEVYDELIEKYREALNYINGKEENKSNLFR